MHRFYSFMLFMVVGCSASITTAPSQINVQQADVESQVSEPTERSDSSESSAEEAFVIDVRTKEEWDTGHVGSAVRIPHDEIADRIGEVTNDKNAKIVLYCKSGGRAGRAKAALENLGYTNVENAGGYENIKDRFVE